MKTDDRPNGDARRRAGLNRREFMHVGGLGVAAYGLMPSLARGEVVAQNSVKTRHTATACIFIKLAGAPSHMDTFDIKVGYWTPEDIAQSTETRHKITLPGVLFPYLLDRVSQHLAILHSVQAYVPVHTVAQYWIDTSQDFNTSLVPERPALGAVVALEYQTPERRRKDDVLPGFVSMIGAPVGGNGFLGGMVAPYPLPGINGQAPARLIPSEGVAELIHARGPEAYRQLWDMIGRIDRENRTGDAPWGKPLNDYNDFYQAGQGMVSDPITKQVFQYTETERQRYGYNGGRTFGDACLVARNLITANRGTHFVHITFNGWDDHQNIYPNLRNRAPVLDAGLAALIEDLAAAPHPEFPGQSFLDKTLIVVMGEFGRTPPSLYDTGTGLSSNNGRDHFAPVQFAAMAGGGVRGGRNIGVTNADGSVIKDPGWSGGQNRPVGPNIRMEDIGVTIYSALDINWTTERRDTPSGRVYQYINGGPDTYYAEIKELFE